MSSSAQHPRCQEIINKISSQEIILQLAGNSCCLYTQMPYDLLIVYKVQKYFASRDCLVLRLKFIACAAQPFSEIYDAEIL
jgi:hypothetical protein